LLRHGAEGQPHSHAKHGQKSKLIAGRKPLFGDPRCRCLCEAARENSKFPNVSLVRDELPYRLRQQSVLGEFGRIAMQTRDLRNILQRATELCANGLEARFAKVAEYQPDENHLMGRAGVVLGVRYRANSNRPMPISSPALPDCWA